MSTTLILDDSITVAITKAIEESDQRTAADFAQVHGKIDIITEDLDVDKAV